MLDLQVGPAVSSSTPAAVATTGTTGGATGSGGVTMQLVQQYASSMLLAHVKSLVADPKDAQLSLLTLNYQDTLLSVDVSQKTQCAP